mgnify:CR=1 FL=1
MPADRDGAGSGGAGSDAVLQARLDALRRAFLDRVPAMVGELRAAVEALEAADTATWDERLAAVRQQAHRTAGTAATYGLTELAEAHRAVERAAGKGGATPDLAAIRRAYAEVERAAEAAGSASG